MAFNFTSTYMYYLFLTVALYIYILFSWYKHSNETNHIQRKSLSLFLVCDLVRQTTRCCIEISDCVVCIRYIFYHLYAARSTDVLNVQVLYLSDSIRATT